MTTAALKPARFPALDADETAKSGPVPDPERYGVSAGVGITSGAWNSSAMRWQLRHGPLDGSRWLPGR